MIYETRVYRCLPGRLPALLKRFENTTTKLWEKHGIKQAGFFTTLVGESNQELTYILAWESLADREKKWGAFATDPAATTGAAEVFAFKGTFLFRSDHEGPRPRDQPSLEGLEYRGCTDRR